MFVQKTHQLPFRNAHGADNMARRLTLLEARQGFREVIPTDWANEL
jgi:hypothetical protein